MSEPENDQELKRFVVEGYGVCAPPPPPPEDDE